MPYGVEKLTDQQLQQVIQMYRNKILRLKTYEAYCGYIDLKNEKVKGCIKRVKSLIEKHEKEREAEKDPKKIETLERMIDASNITLSRYESTLFLRQKIPRLKAKLKACLEEKEKRIKGLTSSPSHGSSRFVDITKATGIYPFGAVTFTNGSNTIIVAGDQTAIVLVGDYIKPDATGYNEWYKVTGVSYDAVANETTITLAWAFAQATVTASVLYNREDGTTPNTAFCHLRQATTDEVRAEGDVIYCRRGQTHLYQGVDIIFDEDGAPNNYITLMGDDGTGWADETGLAKPIISFGDTVHRMNMSGDNYWKLSDFEVIKSDKGFTDGQFRLSDVFGTILEKLDIRDHGGTYPVGMYMDRAREIIMDQCTFKDDEHVAYASILLYATSVKISNSTFDGGTAGTARGLHVHNSRVFLENCGFGEINAHTTGDITRWGSPFYVYGRNVTLASPTEVQGLEKGCFVKIEDYDGVKLANRAWFWNGDIIRDTTVVRVGGATSSARMEPNSNCGLDQPLELCAFTEELSRWLEAGARSVKMYLMGSGWTVLPTADELYVEVYYYDGVTAKRAVKKSTATLPANDVWTEFPIDFVLNSDSPCYVNVVLKKYEAGAKVYVDILPVWG